MDACSLLFVSDLVFRRLLGNRMVCHPWASTVALATVNLPTKFEVSNSTQFEDMKSDTKYQKWGGK